MQHCRKQASVYPNTKTQEKSTTNGGELECCLKSHVRRSMTSLLSAKATPPILHAQARPCQALYPQTSPYLYALEVIYQSLHNTPKDLYTCYNYVQQQMFLISRCSSPTSLLPHSYLQQRQRLCRRNQLIEEDSEESQTGNHSVVVKLYGSQEEPTSLLKP